MKSFSKFFATDILAPKKLFLETIEKIPLDFYTIKNILLEDNNEQSEIKSENSDLNFILNNPVELKKKEHEIFFKRKFLTHDEEKELLKIYKADPKFLNKESKSLEARDLLICNIYWFIDSLVNTAAFSEKSTRICKITKNSS